MRYEDARLIAVDKPSGLLAVPGRGPGKQDCLLSRVQLDYPSASVVHRLDMGTSGLMLFALDAATQRSLSMMFEARKIQKRYVALVRGVPSPMQGDINLALSADWPRRPRQRVDRQSGKAAHTRYRVVTVDADSGASRVELTPTTGRSHQLRVHLAALGHPILGDELYADIGTRRLTSRLMLHATRLHFRHPASDAGVTVRSPAPF